MATKFRKPSKKATIALVVAIVILVSIAVAGTVAFLKDKGRTEAADLEKIYPDLNQVVEENQEQSENSEISENQQPDENQGQIEAEKPENSEQLQGEQTTTIVGNNNQNNEATTREDNIQETIIERIEKVEIPEKQILEGHYVGWTPMGLKAVNVSGKINVNDSKEIEILKEAVTTSGKNLVTRGEEITYKITVKNISDKDINNIEVKDRIPEMTTYVENSADNSAAEVIEDKNVIGLIWNLDLLKAGEEKTVSFKVKVNEDATGVITNIAFANGEETEPVKNAIIEATKTAVIEDKLNETIAKVGDKLIYTITVKNTGNVSGTTNVQDIKLKELLDSGILKLDAESEEVANKLIEGTTVDVPENGEVAISFKVEILKVDGAITNIVMVGEEKPEVTIDTVNITGQKTNTDKDNKVKPGEEFSYNIVLTNSGNAEGTAKVTDSVPEQLEVIDTNPTATVNGNEVDFGDVTVKPGEQVTLTINVKVKETATGTIKNIGKVDGKDVPDTEVIIEDIVNITATKTNNDEDKKVKPEETVVYTIKLSNSGNVAGKTTVTDKLPLGVDYVSSSDEGIYNKETRTVVWNNVNVPVGTNSKELTVTVKISENATGKIINTAIVENKPYNDEGLELVKITATKTNNLQQIAKVNQEVTYTIKAINNGTIAGDAVITDQLPNGLTYKEATLKNQGKDVISQENGLITWNVKDLQPGEDNARELTIVVTVNDFEGILTTITNEVKVDGNKTSDTTIEVGKPVIEALKTSKIISCERNELTGNIVHEGDKIRYTITVNNTGKVEKTIDITDTIKEGLTYVDGTLKVEYAGTDVEGGVVENGVVKLQNYTLSTGGTLTITFDVKVNDLSSDSETKIDKNIAVVDNKNVPDNNEYEVLKPVISAEKTSTIVSCNKDQISGTIVHENDKIKYTITVKNTGRASGKVTVEDTIKDGLSYVEGTLSAKVDNTPVSGIVVKNGKVTLSNYELAAGKTLVIEFTVSVNELPKDVYNKTIDANIAIVNNTETKDDNIYNVVKANIVADKSSSIIECSQGVTTGRIVHEGDKIRYTITVVNNGTEAGLITVSDNIPEGLTYVEGSLSAKLNGNDDALVSISRRQIVLNAYTLAAGKTLTITFDVTVDTLEDGVYNKQIENNIAVVNGENIPDDGGYNVEKPQIESSKVVDKTKAEYNDELIYTITVKNISSVSTDVNINDPIPENTEFVPGSITINNNSVKDSIYYKNGKIIYTGKLTQKDEVVVIKFKVRVTANAIGTVITNKANINNEEKTATTTVVKKVTVGTISSKVNPIDLVLVLDVSGSMDDNGKLAELKTSATTLVNKVFETDTTSTITVITYSASATNNGTFNYSGKNNLVNTINGLKANGGTNIYAALSETNEVIPKLGTDREKVVVFLTDGSPTIPSDSYIENVHSGGNNASGYTNNLKDNIVEQSNRLKALSKVKKVYSIGLGINNFSDTYVRHADECTTDVTSTIVFNKENNTFTIILSNSNNKEVTIGTVNAEFKNIRKLESVSNDGKIDKHNDKKAKWENISIPANGTIELTGEYKANKENPSVELDMSYEKTCITEAHKEQFEGNNLYSVIKTKNGKQYHCITEKTYSKYLLSKISSDGTIMNVTTVSTAFDKILEEISTTTNTYTVENGTVIDIPETHKITSDVKVTIGTTTNNYTLEQLKLGVNGLIYVENVGFKWTITVETLLNNKLLLEYKINE